ncbi:NAD(P)-binding domain-containing protein [Kitasatospora sp. NPDC002551]|uniref:imine reductase family protein n=1 Tax=Kitasatospora sp. NPDC002551 TaxID=3154539 RepID=UPI00331F3BEB
MAVLGLGLMGRALAGAFLHAGHPTTVWNRTPGKAAELAEESAALGVSTELPALVRALAGRALAAGQGGASYAALVEQFRRPGVPGPSAGPAEGE